jgi:hypothetical protein
VTRRNIMAKLTPLALLCAVTGAIALVAPAASAEQLITRQLLEFCNSRDAMLNSACRFYILGVVEGADTADGAVFRYNQFLSGTKTMICLPEGVTGQQMVADYVQAMAFIARKYPDDLNLPAVSTVMSFMAKRYPCR